MIVAKMVEVATIWCRLVDYQKSDSHASLVDGRVSPIVIYTPFILKKENMKKERFQVPRVTFDVKKKKKKKEILSHGSNFGYEILT